MKNLSGQFLEDQNEVASFVLKGWQEGMRMQANPNLFIDLTVQESGANGDNPRMTDACNMFMTAVKEVLRRFEDSYRSED